MKKLMFMMAIALSVFLVSCSEQITDPVNQDNANKSLDNFDQFQYDYFQKFTEIRLNEWNTPSVEGEYTLNIDLGMEMEQADDLFIMVVHADPLIDIPGYHYLYYVNQPQENMIKVNLESDMPVIEVKAFFLDRTILTDKAPSYENNHSFRGIYSTYEKRNNDLVITAMPWTPDVISVFAHVSLNGSDELIFLQRPSNAGKIILSDYGMEVLGVHLFVDSNPFIDKR